MHSLCSQAHEGMIYNIGTDIVSISRIEAIIKSKPDNFISRILSPEEQQILSKKKINYSSYIAKRFAAKEAIAKAFGTGIGKISFQDITIFNYNNGMPYCELSDNLKKRAKEILGCKDFKLHVSLSDDKDCALAFALIELK